MFKNPKKQLFPILLVLLALAGALLLFLGQNGGLLKKSKSASEEDLARFLENGKGVGKAQVSLCFAPDGETVVGAAVVCTGGDDPLVRAEVIRLLCAALDVRSNKIYVSSSA